MGGSRCHEDPGLVLGALLHPQAPPRLPHFQPLRLGPRVPCFLSLCFSERLALIDWEEATSCQEGVSFPSGRSPPATGWCGSGASLPPVRQVGPSSLPVRATWKASRHQRLMASPRWRGAGMWASSQGSRWLGASSARGSQLCHGPRLFLTRGIAWPTELGNLSATRRLLPPSGPRWRCRP